MLDARILFCVTFALLLGGCAAPGPTAEPAPEPAAAAEPVDYSLPEDARLEAFIAFTLAHHPDLRAAEAELEAAEAEATLAGALMDPELSVVAGEMRQSIMLQQRIPLFGKRRLAREQAVYNAYAARARRDEMRLSLTETLVNRYADYAYIQASDRILAEQVELLTQLAEVVRVRYQSGGADQADLLRIENERDSLISEKRNLEDSARAARAQLNAALGRSAQAELPALEPLEYYAVEFDEARLSARLVERNPGLQALDYERVAGELGRELADRAGRPDLMVGVEHMRDDAMSGSDTALMLGVTLPVWRGNYKAERERAQANYRGAQARYKSRQQQLDAELTTALFRWREAERNRELYGEVLNRRAEQAVYAARTAYRAGELGFTDLIDSQRQWLSFQLNHQRALADVLIRRAQITTLTGGRVTQPNEEADHHE